MGDLSIQFVDLLVVGVILASAAFAVYRGFVRETLSIFAWAAAAFATLYFGPAAAALLYPTFSRVLAVVVGYAGTFLLVLVPLSYVSYRISQGVDRSPIGPLDRALGAVFGVIRGLVVVAIAYLVFCILVPIPRQPEWMTEARTLPLIQSAGQVLLSLVPDRRYEDAVTAAAEPEKAADSANAATPPAKPDAVRKPSKRAKKTYGAEDRRALDKLIEATGNGGKSEP